MSITVRLWSDEDLQQAKEDEWIATILMNGSTFSTKEINTLNSLPFNQRAFDLYWDFEGGHEERVRVKAPSLRMLKKFIEAEYTKLPDEIVEIITKFKQINL